MTLAAATAGVWDTCTALVAFVPRSAVLGVQRAGHAHVNVAAHAQEMVCAVGRSACVPGPCTAAAAWCVAPVALVFVGPDSDPDATAMTAAHELGHLAGFPHNDTACAVMAPRQPPLC